MSKISKLEEVSYEMRVFCIHVFCLESLVFLWRRRVYGGSCKTSPFRRFPSRLSCRFAWQAWHFVTFQPVLITCRKCQNWRTSRTKCSFFCTHVSRLESLVFLVASPCLWRKLRHSHTLHSTLHNLHFRLHTPHIHFTLHTLHFALYTPHSSH